MEEITHWKNKYNRGIIKVFWKDTDIDKFHRLGAEGCVDIICSRLTETATGGTYYADHLPVIGRILFYLTVWTLEHNVWPTTFLWVSSYQGQLNML